MILDHALYLTKGGSETISVTDTYTDTDKLEFPDMGLYKESPKPSWAYLLVWEVAAAPSTTVDLNSLIRVYYSSGSYFNLGFPTPTSIPTSVSVGEPLTAMFLCPWRPYPNMKGDTPVQAITVGSKVSIASATMSIKIKLIPFKI